jgi:hypothetical protein
MLVTGILLVILFALVAFILTRRWSKILSLIGGLGDYSRATDDQWTWTTNDGRLYENVEVTGTEGDEVILKHSSGISRVAIVALSIESREKLFRTSFWQHRENPGGPLDKTVKPNFAVGRNKSSLRVI